MNRQRDGELFHLMLTARKIDNREQVLIPQNLAHFYVSGAGHEASPVLAAHLTGHDWRFLHDRDKALQLARGLPAVEFLRSFLGQGGSHALSAISKSALDMAPKPGDTIRAVAVNRGDLEPVRIAASPATLPPEEPICLAAIR